MLESELRRDGGEALGWHGILMLKPFGEKRHRELARKVRAFGDTHLRARVHDEGDPEGGLRELAGLLAAEQLLSPAILPRSEEHTSELQSR